MTPTGAVPSRAPRGTGSGYRRGQQRGHLSKHLRVAYVDKDALCGAGRAQPRRDDLRAHDHTNSAAADGPARRVSPTTGVAA